MTESIPRRAWAGALLLTLLPVLAPAQAPDPDRRTLTVVASGESRTAPDLARIALAVESSASTARSAAEQNARTMDAVIRALRGAGVQDAQIQTRGYQLHPQYSHERQEPRLIGYRAMNMLTVETPRMDQVGRLIDVALEAGANRMDGLSFTVRDAEAAQSEALRLAVERGRRTAETLAAAMGVRLGPVLRATTAVGGAPAPPPGMIMAREMAADVRTPIEPGEQTMAAQVQLVFEIADR
jgi:uncharacterized protein